MNDFLFDQFDPVSAREWKQKIQMDLKGLDYNKELIHQTVEGIDIKPFYHKDIQKSEYVIPDLPSQWKIAECIGYSEIDTIIKQAKVAIEKGVESLHITLHEFPTVLMEFLQKEATHCEIYFHLQNTSKEILNGFKKLGTLPPYWQIESNPISQFNSTGHWKYSFENDLLNLQQLIEATSPKHSIITIDTGVYQNAGANMVQQLAYGMAELLEYLHYFEKINEFPKSALKFKFDISVGSNYFFEIAKIRTFRVLFDILRKEFELKKECYIFTKPSLRNKTIKDFNVNIIRSTTESMSGILGGADAVANLPYDHIYKYQNEFSTHIGRNQLHLLKKESYFDEISNMVSGTYYIENLITQLSQKSLALFKEIEKKGGWLSQLYKGTVQKKIKESAVREQNMFDNGELLLIGSNAFANVDEVLPKIQKPIKKQPKKQKTVISPIISSRLTYKLEKNIIFERKI